METVLAPLFTVYVHQLFALALSIREACDQIFLDTPVPEKGFYINVSPQIHARIDSALIGAANIKKLLRTPEKRGSSESQRVYKFRIERSRLLAEWLAEVDLAEILNTKVRNTLEHFDEYLDAENVKLSAGGAPPAPVAAYNMVLSHWEVTNPRVYPIRVYIAVERRYYNLKHSIDLGRLRDEADAILKQLKVLGAMQGVEEPGGLMIPLRSAA